MRREARHRRSFAAWLDDLLFELRYRFNLFWCRQCRRRRLRGRLRSRNGKARWIHEPGELRVNPGTHYLEWTCADCFSRPRKVMKP